MKRGLAALLIALASLGIYLSNGRTIGSGDTLPARYLPWSILHGQGFSLDAFPILYDDAARQTFPLLDGIPYFLRDVNGHYVSAYPPGPAVAALPVYALPALRGAPPSPAWASWLEKLSAALITALSVALLFCALDQLVSRRWALAIAAIYAFGTSSFSVSSQGLWQHAPSQLFVSLLLYQLTRGLRDNSWLAATGFAMTAAVAMRVTDVLLVLPLAVWVMATRPRLIPQFALFASPPVLAMTAYNWAVFGSVTGGSGNTTVPTVALFSQIPLAEGLSGLLVSPARGLFVYSPVLLLSILGCISVWRNGPPAFRALSAGLPLVIALVSKWFLWWGGHSWGPRLLADTTPVLCFFLYPLVQQTPRRLVKALIAATAVVSIGAHALGAYFYDGRWDALVDPDRYYPRLWSWEASPLAFYGHEIASAAKAALWPAAPDPFTSASAPERLAASISATPTPQETFAGSAIPVTVMARNTGSAVWLSASPHDRGAVRLAWRWFRGDEELPGGRAPLSGDITPGGSAELSARIPVPSKRGDYTLIIDMVSERVTWFAARGSQPIRRSISARPFSIERLVSAPPASDRPVPRVGIATDRGAYRGSDRQDLEVTVAYPHHPRTFDAYLILLRRNGPGFLYDGRLMTPVGQPPWREWVKGLPLPGRAVGRFSLSLAELPPDAYRWHVVLTEPGTFYPVATASAVFSLGS
jgi:hypothetical protein